MEYAIQELPLVVFTTLGPIGAGAFVVLFYLFLRKMPDPRVLRRIDRFTAIPVGFAVVGFLAALLRPANLGNAFYILLTLGQNQITNSVVAYVAFLVLAILYWVLAVTGKLTSPNRRLVLVGLVTVLGLISAVLTGVACLIPALPVWDAPRTVVEMVSAWLFGGSTLGIFVCTLAWRRTEVEEDIVLPENTQADALPGKIMVGAGGLLLFASSIAVFMFGSSVISSVFNVDAIAQSLFVPNALGQVLVVATGVIVFLARERTTPNLFGVALVLATVSVFLLRFCFFGLQIGIGL